MTTSRWYVIQHATENLWWMFDPTHTFDGGWTRDEGLSSRLESESAAKMWATKVGGKVIRVE